MKLRAFFSFLYILCLVQMAAPQINTERVLSIGRNALYFEDYVLSMQYFNRVIQAKPYLAKPYYFRAIAKYNLEDYVGAEQDCSLALERNPYLVGAYNLRGISRQHTGKTYEAINDFTKGLEYEKKNTHLLINRGLSKMREEDYPGAIEDYNRALEINPKHFNAYLTRGSAHMLNKDTLKALDDYTKAIEINPFYSDAYASRGLVLYNQGNFEKALVDYNQAIKLNPDNPGFYNNRGLVRYQLNDLQGTVEDYDRVIELDPNNLLTYFNRGLLRSQIGDENRAIEDFSTVLRLDPDNLHAYLNRGFLQNSIGDYAGALADFNRVIEEYPDFGPAYFSRAETRQALGDLKGAEKDFNTAVALDMAARERKKKTGTTKDNNGDHNDVLAQARKKGKETRKASDKNIRNYNKIVVVDEGEDASEDQYASSIRGKIQNRNIIVDLEPIFVLSLLEAKSDLERLKYFNKELDRYNRVYQIDPPIIITNREGKLSDEVRAQIFTRIANAGKKIEAGDSLGHVTLFMRAMDYQLVQNYNSAMKDYDALVEEQPTLAFAFFQRGNVRFRMVNFINAVENPEEDIQVSLKGNVNTQITKKAEHEIVDYELILNDYNRALELDPHLGVAYLNRGNLYCARKDYQSAIEDYTRAVEIERNMAEAYFNRGLTYIYLGKVEEGTADLSKAGELGLFKAYNIIKRFGTTN